MPGVRGLYAITPDLEDTALLLGRCEQVLKGGASLLQYRNKKAGTALKREQAFELAALCRRHACLFIVNDDVRLAVEVDAQGAHLGGEDGELAEARRLLGNGRLLGASCYNRIELAHAARSAGADYVAFGAAFTSPTKPGAVRAPLALFREGRTVGLPVVAIGGITLDNAPSLLEAGVDALAVITTLFDAADGEVPARQFAALFKG
jgi:thiamine-phosphate pyrophosphorylase